MSRFESMRIAYGQALAEYGAVNPNVVVLDADVSASTQTRFFAKRFPKRFFTLGVAEAGMVDVAVGLALAGQIPFANTFAFLIALRAAEQVRTCVAYARANVKLVGSYGGLSDSKDGPTHHSVCDLAVMRSIPNMTVMVGADPVEIEKMIPLVAEWNGPVYLRVSRAVVPILFSKDHQLKIGKGAILRDGSDITLVGMGTMLGRCLQAAETLKNDGVNARVLEIHTLKPFDCDVVLDAARETGAVVTVEEHSIIGGLGEAVASLLCESCPVPMKRVGINDMFTETGSYSELLDRYGMSVSDIVQSAVKVLKKK